MIVHMAGLGSMGAGMARALLAAGHEVHGRDPVAAAVEALVAAGGQGLAPGTAEGEAGLCVTLNAAQAREALFGPEGLAGGLRPGAPILCCATVAPDDAVAMEREARARGLRYLDAPISGGAAKAAEGRLSVMASGEPEAFRAAAPLLDALAETVHRLGDAAGAGSAMKAVNQLLAGIHIAAMGEAMALAASQGLALDRVVEVIGASAGASWMFANRAPHVVEADYRPRSAVDIWPKDLGIVAAMAAEAGLPLPLVESALGQFRTASAAGMGRMDDAAVALLVARAGGVRLPGDAVDR